MTESWSVETYERIKAEYEVDDWGLITNPGKFEGESLVAVFFWEASMISAQSDTHYDAYGTKCHAFDLREWVDIFKEDGPRELYYRLVPDVENGIAWLVIHEDSQGFVYADWMDQESYEEFTSSEMERGADDYD